MNMIIVKSEVVHLSEKEHQAIELMYQIISGIETEASNPKLIEISQKIRSSMDELWDDYIMLS